MISEEKLKTVISSMLEIDIASVGPDTSTDTVEKWDSQRHMHLVIALEEAFGITIPDDEVTTITSYPIIKAVIEEQLASG
jgi:acyl carrier protein